jgi:transcriptional regulator with XRE-family HTH domain
MVKPDTATMIRKLRLALGLTQEQFAAKVGVTFSTVNRWESGRRSPSPLAMRRIEELQGHLTQRPAKPPSRRKRQ